MGIAQRVLNALDRFDRKVQRIDAAVENVDRHLRQSPIDTLRTLAHHSPKLQDAQDCPDCQMSETLGTAWSLVKGIAERCPDPHEPPGQGIRGVFPVAARVLDQAIAQLPHLNETSENRHLLEELRSLLPSLKARLAYVPTCTVASALAKDLERAWRLSYDATLSVFKKPPPCETCGSPQGSTKHRKG